jgi:adenylate cyclase
LEDVFEVQDELTNTIQNTLLQKVRESGMNSAMNMVLAWAHLYMVWSAWTDDVEQAIERGYEAAQKAIAADRNDFWGHAALGFAELCLHRHERALSALDRALALNPNSADVRTMRGMVLNFLGRPEEGLNDIELAIRHNPHHPDWYLIGIGRANYMLGRYEEAIPHIERLVAATPELAVGRLLLVAVYAASGRLDAARAEVSAYLKINPGLTIGQVRLIVPFQKEEDLERYCDLLRQAGLPED